METEDLVAKASAGDKEALIRLVMDRKDEYYRLAYIYLGNREDSLDALQDMIIILFRNIKALRDPKAFYSWSKTILVNCCRSMLRKRGRVVPLEDYKEAAYNEDYQERENRQDLLQCLSRLNSGQQEVLKLKYFLDMDYEAISKLINIPVGTVKSRVFNGLSKLKALLGGEGL